MNGDWRDAVRPVYAATRRTALASVHRVRAAANRKPVLVHQGIQRSGTNYLSELLKRGGFFVANEVDPRRDDPRHKHFRWQDDKSTIVMDAAFANTLKATSVEEINALSGLNPAQKHVVIFKEPVAWLSSIYRWGVANKWTEEREAFLSTEVAAGWLREWSAYYDKWFGLAESSGELAMIVSYEILEADPATTMSRVHRFAGSGPESMLRGGGEVSRVPHSPTGGFRARAVPWDEESARELVDAVVSCNWRQYAGPSW